MRLSTIKELFMEIKPGDLPDPWDLVAMDIGMERTFRVMMCFEGMNVYTKTLKKLVMPLRDRRVVHELEVGVSAKSVARKYGMTIRNVYNVKEKANG